jgi:hypothetical protein
MDKIYNYSFLIYRTILILILPLLLTGRFLAGAAGHNPPLKTTDYFIFAFIIFTAALLIAFRQIDRTKTTVRNSIRIIIVLLAVVNILFFLNTLYDIWHPRDQIFGNEVTIFTVILSLFIAMLSVLVTGLIKNKI